MFKRFYLSLVALLGLCGAVAVGNYTMTQGSGTNFGSVVISTVHYAQQMLCDLTTPSQCAAVSAAGAVKVDNSAVTQPVSAAINSYAAGALAAGAFATGAAVDGWDITQGAKADSVCGTATGSCSVVALLKYLNQAMGNAPPFVVNGSSVGIGWTGLTPGTPQTGTIFAGNIDATSKGGVAYGAMTNFGTTPGAVKVDGANASLFLGTVAASAGSGNVGTGTQRNVLATDQLALANWGQGATGSAVPSGAVYSAGKAVSAEPAAATTGNLTGATFDLAGKQVTSPYAMRELFLNCAVTLTTTTAATTCTGMGAQGASVKIYITDLACTRSDAGTTSATMTLNDSATTIIDMPNNGGGGGFSKSFNVPLQVAANTAFQVQSGTSLTSVHCSASGFKGY